MGCYLITANEEWKSKFPIQSQVQRKEEASQLGGAGSSASRPSPIFQYHSVWELGHTLPHPAFTETIGTWCLTITGNNPS